MGVVRCGLTNLGCGPTLIIISDNIGPVLMSSLEELILS